jgi:hypothetical protein
VNNQQRLSEFEKDAVLAEFSRQWEARQGDRADAACSTKHGWEGTKGDCKRAKAKPADTKEWVKRAGAAYIGGMHGAMIAGSAAGSAVYGGAMALGATSTSVVGAAAGASVLGAAAISGSGIAIAIGGIAGYKAVKFLLDKIDDTIEKERRASAREMTQSFLEGSPDEIRRKTQAFRESGRSRRRQDGLDRSLARVDAAEVPKRMTPSEKALIKERARAIVEGLTEFKAAQEDYLGKGGGKKTAAKPAESDRRDSASEYLRSLSDRADAACSTEHGWVGQKGSCKRAKAKQILKRASTASGGAMAVVGASILAGQIANRIKSATDPKKALQRMTAKELDDQKSNAIMGFLDDDGAKGSSRQWKEMFKEEQSDFADMAQSGNGKQRATGLAKLSASRQFAQNLQDRDWRQKNLVPEFERTIRGMYSADDGGQAKRDQWSSKYDLSARPKGDWAQDLQNEMNAARRKVYGEMSGGNKRRTDHRASARQLPRPSGRS